MTRGELVIFARSGPFTVTEVAEALGASPELVKKMVTRLTSDGYVFERRTATGTIAGQITIDGDEDEDRSRQEYVYDLVGEPSVHSGVTCAVPGCDVVLARDAVALGLRLCAVHQDAADFDEFRSLVWAGRQEYIEVA